MRSPSPLAEAITRDLLIAETHTWARRIGVEEHIREIRVRPMQRKWASCSSQGRLTFNAELLQMPADFRAAVIVHELLHFKIPNHGPLFRSLQKAFLQRYGIQG